MDSDQVSLRAGINRAIRRVRVGALACLEVDENTPRIAGLRQVEAQ